jgi:hypothetical protein
MAGNKTKATKSSVAQYVAAIDDEKRRRDCKALIKLMSGEHKMAKACLYVRRLADIDMEVLRQLVENSIVAIRKRYG